MNVDRSIESEIEANEMRGNRIAEDERRSAIGGLEATINRVLHPVSDDDLGTQEAKDRRAANDEEQRRGSELPG